MSDYFAGVAHKRSTEWMQLVDAANVWQQAYDLLMYEEGCREVYPSRVERAQVAEQAAYDAWSRALVAFERAENRSRVSQ